MPPQNQRPCKESHPPRRYVRSFRLAPIPPRNGEITPGWPGRARKAPYIVSLLRDSPQATSGSWNARNKDVRTHSLRHRLQRIGIDGIRGFTLQGGLPPLHDIVADRCIVRGDVNGVERPRVTNHDPVTLHRP